MRIQYEILWVEDDNNWYEDTKEIIRDTVDEVGFKMNCTNIQSFDKFKELIEVDGLQKFDLLLVDFKLGDNKEKYGDQVIQLIRDENIYTDIIFYSSQLNAVHQKILENKIEGVYFSDRSLVEHKFPEIFHKTIKKIQEVNTIRGLLMAETSDLDELMVEIIQAALQDDSENKLNDYILGEMRNTVNSNDQKVSLEEAISTKITDSRIFTSFHKAKAINKIYKLSPRLENENFFQNYENDVLKIRNIFGHVKEEDGKLVSTQTGEKEIFNEERCVEIRKNLIKYREQLEKLKEVITSQNEG